MANNPYNRTVIYPLEKPLADDINQGFSQLDRSLRETMFSLLRGRDGFLSTGFLVQASSPVAMSVLLKAGIGFQDAPTDVPSAVDAVVGLDDLARYKPILLATDLTVAVPAAPGVNSRIDLIEVRYNRQTDNPQSRSFLDPVTNAFSPASVDKTLDFNVDGTLAYYAAAAVPTTALAYKSGVVAAVPVAPATDTGYLALVHITVGTAVVVINAANIDTVVRSAISPLNVADQVDLIHPALWSPGGAAGWLTPFLGIHLPLDVQDWYLPLVYPRGTILRSLTVDIFGNGVADVDVQVNFTDNTGSATNVALLTVTNPPAAWAAYTVAIPNSIVGRTSLNETYYLKADPNAAGIIIGNTYITRTPPP